MARTHLIRKILVVGAENLTEVSFSLKPGARAAGPEHTVVAPAGDKAQPEQPGQPVDPDPLVLPRSSCTERNAAVHWRLSAGRSDLFQPDEKVQAVDG